MIYITLHSVGKNEGDIIFQINMDSITSIETREGCTLVRTRGGARFFVKETIEEICQLFANAKNGN